MPLLEAHVFDFSGDLYGREIEVEFVAKLRDERHFATLDALVEQMNLDAAKPADIDRSKWLTTNTPSIFPRRSSR